MIDIKALREHPDTFRQGAALKKMHVDIDRVLALDAQRRALQTQRQNLAAEQGQIEKSVGPQLGKLSGELKKATDPAARAALEAQIAELRAKPAALKARVQDIETQERAIEPELQSLLLTIPQPPDADVPRGTSSDDNVEAKRWAPPGWDWAKSFAHNKGFAPRSHIDLCDRLKLVDFPRGVKMSGTRSYVLTGDGMMLHQAITRYALDFMVQRNGFTPMSVPVLVREECMIGTGFFPAGREQAYLISEKHRGNADSSEPATGHDLYLTGTGEVGLMGLHEGEILDEAQLPLKYVTVSPCFRREAGAAGKDTAGLYRVHVFDKVEQVIICRADEAESRRWHKEMIGYVEALLQSLGLPYRLLQCCTADLGVKNADMIDIECWMPGRGDTAPDGQPTGAFGETHSASRLYDYQCRRLNMRYRPAANPESSGGGGGKPAATSPIVCHSLNNTVAASPRLMIPILEMYQNADGTVTVPEVLRPYMGGKARIG
jgi:seryl-tRNA synthetase